MIRANQIMWIYTIVSSFVFGLVVLILGLVTPGYDHLRHTISRLAIEEYGLIQTINFIQFSICVFLTGLLISRAMKDRNAQRLWFTVFTVSAVMWILVGVFPTDNVEDTHIALTSLSIHGVIHLGIVFLVFVLFPLGVYQLASTLRKEPQFRHLARFTSYCGYTASILCFVWTYLFSQGLLLGYLGLLQKIIAAICLGWMLTIIWAVRGHVLKLNIPDKPEALT